MPGQQDPSKFADAMEVAQSAFANGWIDIADLDARMAGIAAADSGDKALSVVADLKDVQTRVLMQQGEETTQWHRAGKVFKIATAISFGAVVLACAINLVVWALLKLSGEVVYFWPMWLSIPLLVTFVLMMVGRWIDNEAG